MKIVYPGSFDPPTYGHLAILNHIAGMFEHVTVLCAENPDKATHLDIQQRLHCWESYNLPDNTTVTRTTEQVGDLSDVVMVRGIRDEFDMETERDVMLLNNRTFGITKYLYVFSDAENSGISSTAARNAAHDLDLSSLASLVSPVTLTCLLEKALGLDNLFMVVGPPASGKSTFLKMLCLLTQNNKQINTDDFLPVLGHVVKKKLNCDNLLEAAITRESEVNAICREPWLALIKSALHRSRGTKNLFVEVPYGLQPSKSSYRYLGGKILFVGCSKEKIQQRLIERGTPEHSKFADVIPDLTESITIANKNNLDMTCVDSNCTIEELFTLATNFNNKLEQNNG